MIRCLRFRIGVAVLIMATPVFAQFTQLTASDDGSQLYFTSQLMLRGAASTSTLPFPESRLYRFGPDGVTLFAERGILASRHSSGGGVGVASPKVSGDGSVVGFTFTFACITDPECTGAVDEGEIRGKYTLDAGPGTLQLSHNGRWALLTQGISTLIDLTTGQRLIVPPPPDAGSRSLASDGTLLVKLPAGPVGLWKQVQFSPIPMPPGIFADSTSMILTDDATTLLFRGFSVPSMPASEPPGIVIMAVNVVSGKVTTLFQTQDQSQFPTLMGTSSNGQVVLYRQGVFNGPAYIIGTATGKTTKINLPDWEFVSDGTLTGPGDLAFLATSSGRIVKVTLSTGAIETLFPATPFCDTQRMLAAGSRTTLTCNLTGSASTLQGQILINGFSAPVLSALPGRIDIQVPWEAFGTSPSTFSLRTQSNSPFDGSQTITVADSYAWFMTAEPSQSSLFGLDFFKGDWSGFLTTQPGPGDIVHAYMTGLGPVRDAVQTGIPASLTTANPITGTFACRFEPQKEDAETLFAGLAPGMIGIYQVTFRMPEDAGALPIRGIDCHLETTNSSGGIGIISPFGVGANQSPKMKSIV